MTKALFAAVVRAASLGLVSVALVAGCSSTTSGTPSTGGGGAGIGNSSPAPGGGSGGGVTDTGNFCHDWQTISTDLQNVSTGNVGEKLVAKFDALAAEAPAAVKSDVQGIDAYVHGIITGHVDPNKGQQFMQAFEHVGVWIAENC